MDAGYKPEGKIDVKKSPRGETSEMAQKPAPLKSESIKGDDGRGSFKNKA